MLQLPQLKPSRHQALGLPKNLEKEKTGTFIATYSNSSNLIIPYYNSNNLKHNIGHFNKIYIKVFDTKGKLREALKLHSITFISLSFDIN